MYPEPIICHVLGLESVPERVEGVFVVVTQAMLFGDGEGVDFRLELDYESAKGWNGGADNAEIHYKSKGY